MAERHILRVGSMRQLSRYETAKRKKEKRKKEGVTDENMEEINSR
jgi:hypothetical protein